ncbi:hypothetical protein OIU76_022074 [Salix suchowensis]|nr:hypothetical protein OIU76_022074 [Salix suchowensis]
MHKHINIYISSVYYHQSSCVDCIHYSQCLMGKLTPGDSRINDDFNELLGYDAFPVGLSLLPQILPIVYPIKLSLPPHPTLDHKPATADLLVVPSAASQMPWTST